jgi:glyceraldehyde-3-phosphate dehydrogenase type II
MMTKKKIVHVIGTGTIGEPLIGLLTLHKEELGLDEVTFFKNTPRVIDRPMLKQIERRGALLASTQQNVAAFKQLGLEVSFEAEEAIKRATVVIDCTPKGIGLKNKETFYKKYTDDVAGFIAQGSEFGFGKMYARGINDAVLDPKTDQFLHVVSCNTHNISVLLRTIGNDGNGGVALDSADFVCLRRANDISQDEDYIPAPQVGKHSDAQFGTHHARDAYHLFETLGYHLDLYSSACVLPTQYMHALRFSIKLPFKITREEVIARLRENPRVALTQKLSANTIFSFGREHGHYGRILSQTVICEPTIVVRNEREVLGFCFTPQDGNSLLSSIAATMWFMDPDSTKRPIDSLKPYLFQEV